MQKRNPLFDLGLVVQTPGVIRLFEDQSPRLLSELLDRHVHLENDCCEEDQEENRNAIRHGNRIFSVFNLSIGKIYIITEYDRSVTTALLPSEY